MAPKEKSSCRGLADADETDIEGDTDPDMGPQLDVVWPDEGD